MNKWHRNITIVYILRICYSLIFSASVITLFWKKYGLNLFDIFLLQAIFAISMVISEIPTGYIADKIGRKLTIIISCSITCIGWIFYSFSTNFGQFVIAEITIGLGISLLSGTDTSLVYESLLELKDNKSFTKIEGRQIGVSHLSEAISALTGGFIAYFFDIKYLLLLTGLFAFIGLIISLFIKEPDREIYSHPRGTLYGFYKIGRFIFLRSRIVRFVIPLFAACSFSTLLGVWLYQPLWQEMKIPVWLFGILWALLSIPSSIASHFAERIEKLLGKKLIIWFLPLPVVIGYFLTAFLPWYFALIGIYIVPILRGLTYPILAKYIHEETYSDKRATVMSVANWIYRLGYFLIGPFVGWIGNNFSIFWALIFCGIISFISIFIFIPSMVKRIE